MSQKAKSPPARTGGARNSLSWLAESNSENSKSLPNLQQLRANFLARRYCLSPTAAATVASLAFEIKEAR